jgi:hypothetical protein
MKKSFTFIFFILLIGTESCRQPEKEQDVKFDVKYLNLDVYGELYDVKTYGSLIIGLLRDGKFFVLDSNYKHVDSAERKLNALEYEAIEIRFYNNDIVTVLGNTTWVVFDSAFNRKKDAEIKLNNLKPMWFNRFGDATYIGRDDNYYEVRGEYIISKIDTSVFMNRLDSLDMPFGPIDYSDKVYDVSVCGFGEFGGCIYFRDKKTNKVYSLPTYYGDIIFYKNAYHLIHSYDDWSMYIKIKDPRKLYEIENPVPMLYRKCDCEKGSDEYYGRVDSVKRKRWQRDRGLVIYFESKKQRIQTIKTFIYRDNLYSLCMSDSSFHILQHMDDSIRYIQSFPKMDKRINVYTSKYVCSYKNKIVIGLNGTYWVVGQTQVNRTGLVVIDTNKTTISVYEFYKELPYKEPNY